MTTAPLTPSQNPLTPPQNPQSLQNRAGAGPAVGEGPVPGAGQSWRSRRGPRILWGAGAGLATAGLILGAR